MLGTSKEHNFSIKKFLKGRLYMSNNTKQLVKKYNLQLQVTDIDGNGINFTSEDAELYLKLKEQAKIGMIETSKLLVQINEKKLYLMESYSSMKDFVTDVFSMSYQTALNYMSLETNFGSLGIDYSRLPATKLFEIAKDDDKMKALKRVKDPESKLIQFVNELKERDEAAKIEAMKQKKAIKSGEEKPVIRLEESARHLRENLALFRNIVMSPDFDWGNDDNKNDIGKLLEDWKAFIDEIKGPYLIEIERIRAERKPIEDEEAARLAEESQAVEKDSEIKDAEFSENENDSEDSEGSESDSVEEGEEDNG